MRCTAGIILAALLAGSASAAPPDPPLAELLPYYARVTGGLVRPVSDPLPPDATPANAFTLDVSGLNRSRGARDLIDARRAFYGAAAFDDETQDYARPYRYVSAWNQLFHPPIRALGLPLETFDAGLGAPPDEERSEYLRPEFQREIDALSGTELTRGNRLRLLPNSESYREKLAMLGRAKRYFRGAVMFFACDETGTAFLEEAARKAAEGVKVQLIVEGLYGASINLDCTAKMRSKGIDVVLARDLPRGVRDLGVMHHKFWVRDGEEAVIGGQNMHDFENRSDGFTLTRDTDVHVASGPIVTDLEREFLRLWGRYRTKLNADLAAEEPLVAARLAAERAAGTRGSAHYARWLSSKASRMDGLCRVLVQDRRAEAQAIGPVLVEHVEAARSRVFVSSPGVEYEDGKDGAPERLAGAVRRAARERGVRVDVLSNGLPGGMGDGPRFLDRYLGGLARKLPPWLLEPIARDLGLFLTRRGAREQRRILEDLAALPGARAWTYFQYIHAKVQIFDRIAVSVGSFNWDAFSSERNHEETLICMDRALRRQAEGQMTLDLANAVPVSGAASGQ